MYKMNQQTPGPISFKIYDNKSVVKSILNFLYGNRTISSSTVKSLGVPPHHSFILNKNLK